MHIQFCPRPPVQFPKTKNSRTPSFVPFHPWLAGQCVVVRWRENKSFYDILSTSEETLSHAGLGAGKFYLIYASIPPLAVATTAFFKPFCSPPRIALKKDITANFPVPQLPIKRIFDPSGCSTLGTFSQSVCSTEAIFWVCLPPPACLIVIHNGLLLLLHLAVPCRATIHLNLAQYKYSGSA